MLSRSSLRKLFWHKISRTDILYDKNKTSLPKAILTPTFSLYRGLYAPGPGTFLIGGSYLFPWPNPVVYFDKAGGMLYIYSQALIF